MGVDLLHPRYSTVWDNLRLSRAKPGRTAESDCFHMDTATES